MEGCHQAGRHQGRVKRDGHDTDDLFALVHARFLRSEFDFHAEYRPLRELMRRYRSRTIAFADASLVRMAELKPDAVVWTLDRDFQVYRKQSRQSMSLVTPW